MVAAPQGGAVVLDRPDLDTGPANGYLATLEELASLLVEDASLHELLDQVLALTARAITASTAVSVTVVDDDGGYATVASSSAEAERLDAVQYELAEGPCIDALESGTPNRLDDLTEPGRWPRFRARAVEHGFGSVLAEPLRAGDAVVGALNVFAREADALGEDDVLLARRIAAPAAATLANARAFRRVARLADQLQEALASRASIEQAKGILVAQARCTPEEAFERLRRISQDHNVPVREVARRLLDRAATDGRP
ncbi:GAF and ANTAR domain-containing protein [Nitriliruptoraceae bacterium ZYF776]|nr:GAF and ANTAR domain-containing protein [Profundirhabdus halotolerans]